VGEKVAEDSILAAKGLLKLALVSQPDFQSEMWDESSRVFVARPPKVLVDRIADDLEGSQKYIQFQEVMATLSAQNQAKIRNVLRMLLGKARWRSPGQPDVVEEDY
jgi:hypothetical protein